MSDNFDLKSLRIQSIKDSHPTGAPVSDPEPLTGKEKAGVSLTWGIIWVIIGFLLMILSIFVWGENQFLSVLEHIEKLGSDTTPEQLKELASLTSELEKQQGSFRSFWFDTLQLILINVLFPTLTALLGYVFGTSRSNNA